MSEKHSNKRDHQYSDSSYVTDSQADQAMRDLAFLLEAQRLSANKKLIPADLLVQVYQAQKLLNTFVELRVGDSESEQ